MQDMFVGGTGTPSEHVIGEKMTRKDYSPEVDHACVQGQLHNVEIKTYRQHG